MVHPSPAQGKLPLAIIGAGRVGSTLAVALHAVGYPITAVWSRTSAHAADLAARVGAIVPSLESVAKQASLTLIAVSDDSLLSYLPGLPRVVSGARARWWRIAAACCRRQCLRPLPSKEC